MGWSGSFRGGSTPLRKLVILGGWFACLRTVRAIHSNGRKKMRTKMKIGMTTDSTMTTTSESAPVEFSLFELQEPIGRRQGRNADGLRGMFCRPGNLGTSHRLRKLTSSLRGGGNDVAGRYRFPRYEGGKDSSRYSESGSGSLTRLRRGKIRPGFGASAIFGVVGVWQTSVVAESSRGGTGINVSDFQVRVFDLLPERWQRQGRVGEGNGGPAGSSEPVRVVRFRKLATPVAEAGAMWQVANVFAKMRVRTHGGGGCEPVVVGRTHTYTHVFSFFSWVGDSGRFLFCPLSIPTPLGRMRSSNFSL